MSSQPASSLSSEAIQTLSRYTACDISDALLKLKVPNAGFIADLTPYCKPAAASSTRQIKIAPASTVYFIAKTDDGSSHPPANIPKDQHWVDLTQAGTFVVESQPQGQHNAVLGGIMALRMKVLKAEGVVVHGRIRDIEELAETGLTIWAKATSTVGTGADTKPHAVNIPISVGGVTVTPGDYVFSDTEAGVVVIPQAQLTSVLDLLPKLTGADDKVKEAVANGMSVQEAFKTFR